MKKSRQQNKAHKQRKAKARAQHSETYGSWINRIRFPKQPVRRMNPTTFLNPTILPLQLQTLVELCSDKNNEFVVYPNPLVNNASGHTYCGGEALFDGMGLTKTFPDRDLQELSE